MPSIVKILALV